ncbi:unnamed protein product [Psylliodes chrysocephalus]|uniref:DUF4371 domain-containing protein n=1 Tax=Psylliodes chrysocephalus TaxID=3402493 RepID=A0A9P0GIX7_9CUCU|nr:unnamed protein product [Psylliodes chrysocephala]
MKAAWTKRLGNFRELLRFRISSGDTNLKQHLATASSRATYILIKCCGDEILETILNQFREAKYYLVLFDDTTDVFHTKQLSLNLRYVYKNNIYENFVKFIDAYEKIKTVNPDNDTLGEQRLTGEALGKIVINILQKLSLELSNCVGIGTDSCSVMSSEAVGAVYQIQKKAKNALHVVCIRNAVGVMKSVVSFFNMSAKRNQVLKSTLGHQLTSLCKTRWVERHEKVIQFRSGFSQIVEAFTLISVWKDVKTSTIATTLLNSLCTTEFLLSMFSLIDILKITLSRLLQMPNLDANGASTAVSNTMSTINEKRKNCEQNFDKIYKKATEVATGLDIEIKLPRLAGRQTKQENYPGGKEEYYRRSIYIHLFDNVSNDLSSRLRFSSLDCFGLREIIPSILAEANRDNKTILIKN